VVEKALSVTSVDACGDGVVLREASNRAFSRSLSVTSPDDDERSAEVNCTLAVSYRAAPPADMGRINFVATRSVEDMHRRLLAVD
jgi:D-alanine-D-alanine ligase-like ATP-grasp enzyme